MRNKLLITFDLEEFDLPLEFGKTFSSEQQLEVSRSGLLNLIQLLNQTKYKFTFFPTAFFAENNKEIIQYLHKQGHEIASHMFYHSEYLPEHVKLSKEKIEEIIGKEISGIRIPRLKSMPHKLIEEAGYSYDSSVNPCYLPGRYNNFRHGTEVVKNNNLWVLPMSVATKLRIPLFWLAFKHLPFGLYQKLCIHSLKKEGFLHLYFHPWEFVSLNNLDVPNYISRHSGEKMLLRLKKLIDTLSQKGEFTTCEDYLKTISD